EADARRALDAFPAPMALLRGDEADRLEAIRLKLEDARKDLTAAARDLETAEAARAASGLPDDGVAHETLTALREHTGRLADLRRTIETCERELAKAVAARDELARAIGVTGAAGDPPGSVALDELADFARDAADLLGRAAAADAELRWLGADIGPGARQGADPGANTDPNAD